MNGPNDHGSRTHPDEVVLHDLLDGELEPDAAAGAREHVEDCPACRRTLEGLEVLRERARALPREVEPTRDLWAGIEAGLRGTRGGGRAPEVESAGQRASPRRGPRERRASRPRRWAAGPGPAWGLAAAAGLAALAAGTLLFTGSPVPEADEPGTPTAESPAFASEVRTVEEAYRPAIEELRALADARDLAPETRAVLDENLALIEQAIADSREAVQADPQARMALENLRRMYDAKIEALRTVAVRP